MPAMIAKVLIATQAQQLDRLFDYIIPEAMVGLLRVGSRVRLGLTLLDVNEKNPGQWLIKARATLEIEGQEKPAYIAETLSLCFV